MGGPCAPYYQSQRTERYRAAVSALLARGLAYRDYATAEETTAEREAAHREKRRFIYQPALDGGDRRRRGAVRGRGTHGRRAAQVPREGACRFDDLVRGALAFGWAIEQDHVISGRTAATCNHLASAVDDHDFEISHVIRAEEHLSNTPRQIFIADGLGYKRPRYAHLPYVRGAGRQ